MWNKNSYNLKRCLNLFFLRSLKIYFIFLTFSNIFFNIANIFVWVYNAFSVIIYFGNNSITTSCTALSLWIFFSNIFLKKRKKKTQIQRKTTATINKQQSGKKIGVEYLPEYQNCKRKILLYATVHCYWSAHRYMYYIFLCCLVCCWLYWIVAGHELCVHCAPYTFLTIFSMLCVPEVDKERRKKFTFYSVHSFAKRVSFIFFDRRVDAVSNDIIHIYKDLLILFAIFGCPFYYLQAILYVYHTHILTEYIYMDFDDICSFTITYAYVVHNCIHIPRVLLP